MNILKQTISSIVPVDWSLESEIRSHIDNLTKPIGSLGRLEDLAAHYCLITHTLKPSLGKKRIFTFAGDHGVAEEGVSAFPKKVTSQMVRNMLDGGAAVNVLAKHVGAEIYVIDIGVDDPLENAPGLIRRKIRAGTNNIAKGPAMTEEEAVRALEIGIDLVKEAHIQNVALIGTGEMGIANTTPSSALFAALIPSPAEEVTGRGTGIDDLALAKKIRIIKQALDINKNRLSDPLSTLAALGGFEIAGLCGVILGAASCRIPVIVDGFISTAGALVAGKICPLVKEYLFFSHLSDEAGHKKFFECFGVEPLLNLRMRLGEGTGAALAMSLIEVAVKIYNEMATFNSANISGKTS